MLRSLQKLGRISTNEANVDDEYKIATEEYDSQIFSALKIGNKNPRSKSIKRRASRKFLKMWADKYLRGKRVKNQVVQSRH